MNDEMKLRYLYFLTHMNSGTKQWQACYNAWREFGNGLNSEEYSKLIGKVQSFHKKYLFKKGAEGLQVMYMVDINVGYLKAIT